MHLVAWAILDRCLTAGVQQFQDALMLQVARCCCAPVLDRILASVWRHFRHPEAFLRLENPASLHVWASRYSIRACWLAS